MNHELMFHLHRECCIRLSLDSVARLSCRVLSGCFIVLVRESWDRIPADGIIYGATFLHCDVPVSIRSSLYPVVSGLGVIYGTFELILCSLDYAANC